MKESIVESNGYETLTIDELYSKLKASEVDAQAQARMSGPTPKSLALMSSPSGGAMEEELEALDDDKLCLLSNKFQCLYSNRMSHRRGDKLQCYEAQEKYSDGKDHKYKGEYTFDKKKGKYKGDKKKRPYFSKREFMKQYQKHAQERDRAFLASLSDCDGSSSDSSFDSDEDGEKKTVGHAGLYFFGDEIGYCTMAIKGDQAGSTDSDVCNKSNSEPQVSGDDDEAMFTVLRNQDRLLRVAAKDHRLANAKVATLKAELETLKSKLDCPLNDLSIAKEACVIANEIECTDCQVLANELSDLRSKHATNVDLLFSTTAALEELKARPTLLGACAVCLTIRKELEEVRAALRKSEKITSPVSVDCSKCKDLGDMLDELTIEKVQLEDENTDIGDLTGIPLSEKFPLTHNKPSFQPDNHKDGVWTDKPREPPKKQVWTPKPNFVRNPLDTLLKRNPPETPPESSKQGAKRNVPPKPAPQQESQPKKPVQSKSALPKRYVYDYCHREGYLVEFCYRRLRAERREAKWRNEDRYY
ncbi:hypothetical protein U9M48_002478 [Paspalum notatum var. saurae]|uniref:Uncharacterized protein n=1 Tax=Paspalum notatum var. saurae TaxID=547442 RepID=A0AAQ3PL28_PASNO